MCLFAQVQIVLQGYEEGAFVSSLNLHKCVRIFYVGASSKDASYRLTGDCYYMDYMLYMLNKRTFFEFFFYSKSLLQS